jgi:hypothetical protein
MLERACAFEFVALLHLLQCCVRVRVRCRFFAACTQRVIGLVLGAVEVVLLKYYTYVVDQAQPGSWPMRSFAYLATGPFRWGGAERPVMVTGHWSVMEPITWLCWLEPVTWLCMSRGPAHCRAASRLSPNPKRVLGGGGERLVASEAPLLSGLAGARCARAAISREDRTVWCLRQLLLGFYASSGDFSRRLTSIKANNKFEFPWSTPDDYTAVRRAPPPPVSAAAPSQDGQKRLARSTDCLHARVSCVPSCAFGCVGPLWRSWSSAPRQRSRRCEFDFLLAMPVHARDVASPG